MAMKPVDSELDPHLSALYRAGADAGPPDRLDAAIRAAARRAVNAGPRKSTLLRRWQLPLSLAAVVVVSVTLVMQMREEGADRWEAEGTASTRPAEPRNTQAPASPAAAPPASPAPAASGMQQRPPPAPAESSRPSHGPAAPVLQPDTIVKPATPTAAGPIGEARITAADDVLRNTAKRDEAAPAAPKALMRSAPAPAAAGLAAESAVTAQAPARLMAFPEGAALWQDLDQAPPEQWRQRILEWHRAGRAADAKTLTAEYRRRFPQEPLPELPPQP